ncbi:diamine acetyltransferase 2 [Biomphalaria pfeifferi]|uniref:Diamine acetyltransferase 2 n=1 Tax=Biomphalaria pfeifferi TaxID=112525 RepID=A0AAD8F414_BIOPF|nr:diamine acetyltransferase 2 [Biomphalaria pfeifferi]
MDNSLSDITIRAAKPEDCHEIVRLIKELAVFEKLEDQVKMTAEVLQKDCFGDRPLCYCIVAKQQDSPELVGYALYFSIYSTFEGASLHLEDLYVNPAYRGRGIGTQLWKRVTKHGLDLGCNRLQLTVLGWNTKAKDLYTHYGFKDLTESEGWHLMRMSRATMEDFVKG